MNKHFYTFVEIENRFIDYKPFILSQGFDLKYATIRIPKVFYCNKNVQHFNNTLDAFGPGLRNYFNLEPATMGNASPAVIVVKSLINGNLYFTPEELQRRIIHCNYVIKKDWNLLHKNTVKKFRHKTILHTFWSIFKIIKFYEIKF